jgi:DNA polymerase-1
VAAEYGSLDEDRRHAGEIGGKVGENLRKHLDFLPLGASWSPSNCDLELPVRSPTSLRPPTRRRAAPNSTLPRLEFKGWLANWKKAVIAPAAGRRRVRAPRRPGRQPPGAHRTRLRNHPRRAAFDAGWRSSTPRRRSPPRHRNHQPRPDGGAAGRHVLRADAGRGAYLPLAHATPTRRQQLPRDETLAKLKPWLESAPRKLGQNLKYDRHVLANHGIAPRRRGRRHAARILCARSDKATTWIRWHPPPRPEGDQLRRSHRQGRHRASASTRSTVARAAEYAAEDADITLRLHEVLHAAPGPSRLEALYRDIELPVCGVLFAWSATAC